MLCLSVVFLLIFSLFSGDFLLWQGGGVDKYHAFSQHSLNSCRKSCESKQVDASCCFKTHLFSMIDLSEMTVS